MQQAKTTATLKMEESESNRTELMFIELEFESATSVRRRDVSNVQAGPRRSGCLSVDNLRRSTQSFFAEPSSPPCFNDLAGPLLNNPEGIALYSPRLPSMGEATLG